MTVREFLRNVNQDRLLCDRLTDAIKREWGGRGVSSAEPYLSNGASRALYAVMAELDELAPLDTASDEQEGRSDG